VVLAVKDSPASFGDDLLAGGALPALAAFASESELAQIAGVDSPIIGALLIPAEGIGRGELLMVFALLRGFHSAGEFTQLKAGRLPEINPLPESTEAVGIDVGLISFATLSDGTEIDNPRFFGAGEKELAKVQRKLSAAPKGTPERRKRRKVVARVHERIANRRSDFAHQVSRQLVLAFGLIVFEKLNVLGMVKNGRLSKSIADAAWSQLISCTTSKAACAGRRVILVDPRGTSLRCSRCGEVVKKTLAERTHHCHLCGLRLDRDHNAALNILRLGLQSVGLDP
jgi:IS605 OrfB family transposase